MTTGNGGSKNYSQDVDDVEGSTVSEEGVEEESYCTER